MRVEYDEKGDLFVDPEYLSGRLNLTEGELRRRMRIGLVTSLVEKGTGSDEGSTRITVRSGRTIWRAMIDRENNITSEEWIGPGETPVASRPRQTP